MTLAGDAVATLRWLQQPGTWVRIAKIGIGGALILAAGILMVQGTFAPKALQLAAGAVGGKGKLAAEAVT